MIPFARPDIGDTEVEAVARVMRSGILETGPEVAAFEGEFAAAVGAKYAVATNSGTAACLVGFAALDLEPGAEVICPSLSFVSPVLQLLHLGLKPVLCDVDPVTLCVRAKDVEPLVTPKTTAVMVTHFGGIVPNMDELWAFCATSDIALAVDAAHCEPSQQVGAGGEDFAFYSFYATKCMTTGHGGMLVTDNPTIAQCAKLARLHGLVFNPNTPGRYDYDLITPGYKANMPDTAAAMGRVQLGRNKEMRDRRAAIALIYDEMMSVQDGVTLSLPPRASEISNQSHYMYPILVNDAPEFIRHMRAYGVECSVHFRPIHTMRFWRDHAQLPNTEATVGKIVSLPIYSKLTDFEAKYIAESALLSAVLVS